MMKEVADLIRLGFPESTATKIASGELPMDTASRMQRAKEQGYDVDTPVYHGTDADFDEFDPERAVGSQFWSTTNKAAVESREVGAAGHGVIKELLHRINNPADWDDYDNLLLDEIIGRGYDGLKLPDPDGNSVMVAFEPEQYKSVDAAFDPDYKGPNLLGEYALPAGSTALMASLLAAPEEAEAGFVTRGGRELLEAWHGSPHEFDRFSMDAIGTGEGAQAYGHGLYMADSKDVAKGYRDALTPRDYEFEEAAYNRYKQLEEVEDYEGMEVFELAMSHESPADMRHRFSLDERSPEVTERINQYIDEVESMPTNRGALYRTEIDVTPDQLLDYDKPLSEQSDAVRNGVASTEYYQNLRSNMLGSSDDYVDRVDNILSGSTYSDLMDHSSNYGKQNPSLFSSQLSENNVKGIKYLDGNSRNRPMRDVKAQFLNELPEDAEIDDVIELLDGDTFSPENKTLLQSLAADDWLGFDYPSQSLSAVLGDNLSNYDASPELKEVIRAIRDKPENTSNYVIFDDKLINIAERGAATPGMMALLAAGGAGATAAGSESNAVTEATSRIVNHMLDNVTEVTDLLEIPQRGIQGLLRAGYGLMQGDGLDASLNAGADVVNQGVEATAKQAGDAMLEKTGNPELATMAYTAVMLGSPL
jgi:hypothetical protein